VGPHPVIPRQTKGSILHLTEAESKIKFHRRPGRVLIVWGARNVFSRNVFSRRFLTLITWDDGMGAKQIGSYEPGTRGTGNLSSPGSHEQMGRTCREERQRQLIRLPHLVGVTLMIVIRSDDVTMNVGIGMEIVEIKEAEEDVDMSILKKTKGTPCLTSIITHLTCNCGGADINSTYRQCLVSMHNSTTYFTALTLFDTGAYTSFVNRKVAK
jgi:hypothetical protein